MTAIPKSFARVAQMPGAGGQAAAAYMSLTEFRLKGADSYSGNERWRFRSENLGKIFPIIRIATKFFIWGLGHAIHWPQYASPRSQAGKADPKQDLMIPSKPTPTLGPLEASMEVEKEGR